MKKAKARSKTIPTIVRIRRTLLELSLFPIEISPNDERVQFTKGIPFSSFFVSELKSFKVVVFFEVSNLFQVTQFSFPSSFIP